MDFWSKEYKERHAEGKKCRGRENEDNCRGNEIVFSY